MSHKTLQELTILDAFMFGAVMENPDICKDFLELVLGFPIDHVEIDKEKSLQYHPEYKGVRLDVLAKDAKGTRFNVEMQVNSTPIERRSRYYHSQMDMDMLEKGMPYDRLPDAYVIFICNYSPFDSNKYMYTFESTCKELPSYTMNDGVHTIILSNRGENAEEVPKKLVDFLEYTKEEANERESVSENPFIRRVQDSIRRIKNNRNMEGKYMQLQLLLEEAKEEARKEGREEGRREEHKSSLVKHTMDILEFKWPSSDAVISKLDEINDMEVLEKVFQLALRTSDYDAFTEELQLLTSD